MYEHIKIPPGVKIIIVFDKANAMVWLRSCTSPSVHSLEISAKVPRKWLKLGVRTVSTYPILSIILPPPPTHKNGRSMCHCQFEDSHNWYDRAEQHYRASYLVWFVVQI